MKININIIYLTLLILLFNNESIYANYQNIYHVNAGNEIKKIIISDINENDINEVIIQIGYKKVILYEWDNNKFESKWESREFKDSINIEFNQFTPFLLINKYNFNNFYLLIPKGDKYLFKEITETKIPSLHGQKEIIVFPHLVRRDQERPIEIFHSSGSFKDSKSNDIILTIPISKNRERYLNIREIKPPFKLLWSSPFKIDKTSVSIFGDFNGDNRIELLNIGQGTTNYWVNKEKDAFNYKIFKRIVEQRSVPLLQLNPSAPDSYLKVGRTVTAKRNEIVYIYPTLPFSYGDLIQATWQKGEFSFIEIMSIKTINGFGFDKLNVTDIDNNGLDDIIVTGVRGSAIDGIGDTYIEKRSDIVCIIKWDGKKYVNSWTSQSLGEITVLIVDDVTGDGKKEIIVGNRDGDVYIFGQK